MRVSFYGAAGEVTGSCYLVETDKARLLVDFGLHQGGPDADKRNHAFPPLNAPTLSAVVLTHAHIDHSGRLPLLIPNGFRGQVYATPASCRLTDLLLKDSARLQEADARRDSLREERRGSHAVQPLYREEDIAPLITRLVAIDYDAPKEIAPGVRLRFTDAGHILGSASAELTLTDAGRTFVLVFSGDLGPKGVPLMHDPKPPADGGSPPDLVVLESTYGDRDHRTYSATVEEFGAILHDSVWNKHKVLIPAFAVGRTQSILYCVGEFVRSGRLPVFPIYLDSPMAAAATDLYRQFMLTLDDSARALSAQGDDPLCLKSVVCTEDARESKALNDKGGPMVIIAGSGMCTGGRIVHHLRHNLWKRDVRVVIAGYQSVGSLGRRLVDGADEVRIFGDPVPVRAKIHTLGGFSAHAGQGGLLEWAHAFRPRPNAKPPLFALTHGEDKPREALRAKLHETLGVNPVLPRWGSTLTL